MPAARFATSAKTRSPRKRSAKRPSWYVRTLRVVAVLVALAALGVFCYWAGRFTLTPIHDHGQAVGNTHPGRTLRFYLDRQSIREAVLQIGGNLALLAPLGILLPVVFTRLRGIVRVTLVALVVSLAIEVAQGALIEGRAFDADDVILNVIGVILMYLIVGRRVARLVRGPR
jgi:hypothetical protein